jgi:hypothetical protein
MPARMSASGAAHGSALALTGSAAEVSPQLHPHRRRPHSVLAEQRALLEWMLTHRPEYSREMRGHASPTTQAVNVMKDKPNAEYLRPVLRLAAAPEALILSVRREWQRGLQRLPIVHWGFMPASRRRRRW